MGSFLPNSPLKTQEPPSFQKLIRFGNKIPPMEMLTVWICVVRSGNNEVTTGKSLKMLV